MFYIVGFTIIKYYLYGFHLDLYECITQNIFRYIHIFRFEMTLGQYIYNLRLITITLKIDGLCNEPKT